MGVRLGNNFVLLHTAWFPYSCNSSAIIGNERLTTNMETGLKWWPMIQEYWVQLEHACLLAANKLQPNHDRDRYDSSNFDSLSGIFIKSTMSEKQVIAFAFVRFIIPVPSIYKWLITLMTLITSNDWDKRNCDTEITMFHLTFCLW